MQSSPPPPQMWWHYICTVRAIGWGNCGQASWKDVVLSVSVHPQYRRCPRISALWELEVSKTCEGSGVGRKGMKCVTNIIWSSFFSLKKSYIITVQNFWAFQLVFKKSKTGFTILFSKSDSTMEELNLQRIFSEKAKPLRINPSFRIGGFWNLIFTFVNYHPRLIKMNYN